jgi:hypothetical protein
MLSKCPWMDAKMASKAELRLLLFEFTSLSETNLKVPHYGIAANARANINALSTKFLANSPRTRKLSHFIEKYVHNNRTLQHWLI